MFRHILKGVPLLLLVLNNVLAINKTHTQFELSTPFQSEFAYRYFSLAADYLNSLNSLNSEEKQCLDDLNQIKTSLDNYEEWAIEFPDSWGRLPFGLMWGHAISMGQFEECIAISQQNIFRSEIRGQYCLAKVPIKGFISKIHKRNSMGNSRAISYKKTDLEVFELGICVPSSCSAALNDRILKRAINDFYGEDIKATMVTDNFCKIDEPIKLRPIDIFAIIFISFIVLCMIASSIYDYVKTQKQEPKSPLFLSFSVLHNAPKIFSGKKVQNPNVIHCLSGLRCFSMMWVVLGHGFMTFYDLPHINKYKVFNWTETPFSMLIQNGSLCVDTFFFMSGLLIVWTAFREMEKNNGKLNVGMMYLHRYIRLTPVVAVVILYIMSLYKYSGAGPMWMKIGTQDKRCENTWWATLLYVQNYVYPYGYCMSQSWYLAVDTQLYVISPIFIIPLWKWGKKAMPVVIIFGILTMGCAFATFLVNGFTLFRVQDDKVDLRQAKTYYPTHTRITTWLIGLIFGYYLFTKNRGRQIPLAKPWVVIGWFLALGCMVADLWGPYWRILPENANAPLLEGAFYETFSRISWVAAMSWIVWACYNGHGGIINDFLSWGFFIGLSRLTYCMYVIHRIVQFVNAGRLQTSTHFSTYDALLRWWHDFGWTLVASIFATLAFEAPILGIEKAIFGKGESKPKAKKVEEANATAPEPFATIAETHIPQDMNKV